MKIANIYENLMRTLRFRVRVPLIRRQVRVVYLGLLGVVVMAGAAGVCPRSTILCGSCHHMKKSLGSWHVSTHKDVACERCHDVPGWLPMIEATFGLIDFSSGSHARITDKDCRACHDSTDEVIVYHGLKMTHKKHLERNIGCLVCHSNVGHGGTSGVREVPSMRTCATCHDGKTAPSSCGTCHESLAGPFSARFSAEWVRGHKREVREQGREKCERCHSRSSCENCHRMAKPHPVGWIQTHPKEYRADPESCCSCHPKSEWKDFCDECHAVKRAHTSDWVGKHPASVAEHSGSCDRCHDRPFCGDCHKQYKYHPIDWVETHVNTGWGGISNPAPTGKSCSPCHTMEFCSHCHENKLPETHKSAVWGSNHARVVAAEGKKCVRCHPPAYCSTCHRNKKPASHARDWTHQHGLKASAENATCGACHSKSYCDKCHGMQMPHPAGWMAVHSRSAKRNRAVCERCHNPMYCASCHRGRRPSTHSGNWIANHGAQARGSNKACMECHTRELCANCHTYSRPASHVPNWLHTHGAAKSSKCFVCHGKSSCVNCHGGVEMPHPSSWMGAHGGKGASFKDDSPCLKCHQKKPYCGRCHPDKV